MLWNEHFIYGLVGHKDMLNIDDMCATFQVDKKEVKTSNKINYIDEKKKIKFSVKYVLEFEIILTKKNQEYE